MDPPTNIQERSALTLMQVQQNDPALTRLFFFNEQDDVGDDGCYLPNDMDELSRMGNYIGDNTHLEQLFFDGRSDGLADAVVGNEAFFDGLKRNTSIKLLGLGNFDFSGGVGHEILNEYVLNNTNLNTFVARDCNLLNGGARCPEINFIYMSKYEIP